MPGCFIVFEMRLLLRHLKIILDLVTFTPGTADSVGVEVVAKSGKKDLPPKTKPWILSGPRHWITVNGWCACGKEGGGECSVNERDGKRLLSQLSPTFS